MNDDQISVKITADSAEVKTGMAQASDATKAAIDTMNAAVVQLTANVEKQTEVFVKAMGGVEKQFKKTGDEAKSSIDRMLGTLNGFAKGAQEQLAHVAESFEKVKGVLVTFAAVAAGGAALKKVIDDTNKWNGEAGKLSKQLGITTEAASIYMVALHKIGVDSDTLANAAQKVALQLAKGSEGFKDLGVNVRNASNTGFRPAADIITETTTKLSKIHDPIARDIAGFQAFGKAWADVKPLMKLTSDGMEEAAEKAQQLGLIVSGDASAQSKQYAVNMREIGLALEAVEIGLGNALLPAFTQLTESMASVAGIVVSVLRPAFEIMSSAVSNVVSVFSELASSVKGVVVTTLQILGDVVGGIFGSDIPKDLDIVGNSIKVIEIGFVLLAESIKASLEGIAAVIEGFERGVVMLAKMINSALKGDFAGAKTAWDQGLKQIDEVAQRHAEKIVQIQADAKKKIDEIMFGKPNTSEVEKENDDAGHRGKQKKDKQDPGRTPQWETELAAKKDALGREAAMNGTFREMSKQEEANYWAAILQRADLTTNEKLAVQKKYYALEAQVRKDAFEVEVTQLNASKEEMGKNYQARIDIAQQVYDKVAAAYGKESKEAVKAYAEILKERKALADQITKIDQAHAEAQYKIHQIEIDAAEKAAAADLELTGATEAQKVASEQRFLDQKYALEVQDLQRRLALLDPDKNPEEYQRIKDQLLEIDAKYQAQKQGLDSKAKAAAMQPLTDIMQSTQQTMAQALNGMMQRTQSFSQGMQSIWRGLGSAVTQQLANMTAAMVMNMAKQALLGKTQVMQQAYQAAAKAYQAMVGIPVVGPFIAPVAAAGAFVAVEAYGSQIPSASQGFDIPAGVNPLTQLHEKEMVLPREQAEAIRNMTGQGAGSAGVALHVHAVDAASVERLFRDNGHLLVKELRRQHRNGAF
jgi:hypothetical protein